MTAIQVLPHLAIICLMVLQVRIYDYGGEYQKWGLRISLTVLSFLPLAMQFEAVPFWASVAIGFAVMVLSCSFFEDMETHRQERREKFNRTKEKINIMLSEIEDNQ